MLHSAPADVDTEVAHGHDGRLEQAIVDRQRVGRARLGEELRRARLDAGISLRAIAGAAHIRPVASGAHRTRHCLAQPGCGGCHRDSIGASRVDQALSRPTGRGCAITCSVRMEEALLSSPPLHAGCRPPRGRGRTGPSTGRHRRRAPGACRPPSSTSSVRPARRPRALPSAQGWPWADAIERAAEPRGCSSFCSEPSDGTDLVRAARAAPFRAAYPADPAEAPAALTTGDGRWPRRGDPVGVPSHGTRQPPDQAADRVD